MTEETTTATAAEESDAQQADASPAPESASSDGSDAKSPDAKPLEYGEFSVPDGMEVNEDLLAGFREIGVDSELPQEQAQKLIDLYTGDLQRQAKLVEEQQEAWEAEIKSDPDHEQILGKAKKALDTLLGDSEQDTATRQLLQDTPLGSHPGLIRLLAKVGTLVAEDGFVEGGKRSPEPRSLADRIYGATST